MNLTDLFNSLQDQEVEKTASVYEDDVYEEAGEIVKEAEEQVDGLMKTAGEYYEAGQEMARNELAGLVKMAMDYGISEEEIEKIAEDAEEEAEATMEPEEKKEKDKAKMKEGVKQAIKEDPEYAEKLKEKYVS